MIWFRRCAEERKTRQIRSVRWLCHRCKSWARSGSEGQESESSGRQEGDFDQRETKGEAERSDGSRWRGEVKIVWWESDTGALGLRKEGNRLSQRVHSEEAKTTAVKWPCCYSFVSLYCIFQHHFITDIWSRSLPLYNYFVDETCELYLFVIFCLFAWVVFKQTAAGKQRDKKPMTARMHSSVAAWRDDLRKWENTHTHTQTYSYRFCCVQTFKSK